MNQENNNTIENTSPFTALNNAYSQLSNNAQPPTIKQQMSQQQGYLNNEHQQAPSGRQSSSSESPRVKYQKLSPTSKQATEENDSEEEDEEDEDEEQTDLNLGAPKFINESDKPAKKEGEYAEKKGGRRKINIEFIENKSRRHVTFSKRKAGLIKKAFELSTLTGTQVLLLVASETGNVYTFATPKLQPLITKPEGKTLIQSCLNPPEVSEGNQPQSPTHPQHNLSHQHAHQHSHASGPAAVAARILSNSGNNNPSSMSEGRPMSFYTHDKKERVATEGKALPDSYHAHALHMNAGNQSYNSGGSSTVGNNNTPPNGSNNNLHAMYNYIPHMSGYPQPSPSRGYAMQSPYSYGQYPTQTQQQQAHSHMQHSQNIHSQQVHGHYPTNSPYPIYPNSMNPSSSTYNQENNHQNQ